MNSNTSHRLYAVTAVVLAVTYGCGGSKQADVRPEGKAESAKTRVLETGAKVFQRNEPLEGMDIYLVGFHPMKAKPEHQMEVHHFCRQVNQDFAHCALFDGNGKDANLNGIEYIISEKVFETLPAAEKQYWHPHNYEILSGQLQAPGIPAVAEKELMRMKMNSYGKTWHVWMAGEGAKLPFGDAMLAWSFNRDGEIKPELLQSFEKRFPKPEEKRRERADLVSHARPQMGVDALKGAFSRPTSDIPGVANKGGAPK